MFGRPAAWPSCMKGNRQMRMNENSLADVDTYSTYIEQTMRRTNHAFDYPENLKSKFCSPLQQRTYGRFKPVKPTICSPLQRRTYHRLKRNSHLFILAASIKIYFQLTTHVPTGQTSLLTYVLRCSGEQTMLLIIQRI